MTSPLKEYQALRKRFVAERLRLSEESVLATNAAFVLATQLEQLPGDPHESAPLLRDMAMRLAKALKIQGELALAQSNEILELHILLKETLVKLSTEETP